MQSTCGERYHARTLPIPCPYTPSVLPRNTIRSVHLWTSHYQRLVACLETVRVTTWADDLMCRERVTLVRDLDRRPLIVIVYTSPTANRSQYHPNRSLRSTVLAVLYMKHREEEDDVLVSLFSPLTSARESMIRSVLLRLSIILGRFAGPSILFWIQG